MAADSDNMVDAEQEDQELEDGTLEAFLSDLTELSEKHGMFVANSDDMGPWSFSVIRLNSPHERPSEYPDVDVLTKRASYTTLSEFYGDGLWMEGEND